MRAALPALLAGLFAVAGLLLRSRPALSRAVAAVGLWLALAALIGFVATAAGHLELPGPDLGDGVRLTLSLDPLGAVVGGLQLLAAALLVTFGRPAEPALAALIAALALTAVLAGGLLLAALAVGLAVNLLHLHLVLSGRPPGARLRLQLDAAWLALAVSGALLLASGTEQYAALPVSQMTVPAAAFGSAGALLAAGLLAWRPWPARLAIDHGPALATLPAVLLWPVAFALLLRLQQAGGGSLPGRPLTTLALAALAAVVTAIAAWRAQGAVTQADYLGQAAVGAAGWTLFAIAVGGQAGILAGLVALAAALLAQVVRGLLPGGGRGMALALIATVGLPPTLPFAARALALQAALQAGELTAYLGLIMAAAWVTAFAAGARCLRLPPASGAGRGVAGAWVAGVLLLVGGVALGALLTLAAVPAAAVVAPGSRGVTGFPLAVETAAGRWDATLLGGLVAVGLLAVVARGGGWHAPAGAPAPPLSAPAAANQSVRELRRRLRSAAEVRLTGWGGVDAALTASRLWPWLAFCGVLLFLVLR